MFLNFVLEVSSKTRRYAIQQFRITTWPGRLPHPAVSEPFRYRLSEDGVLAADIGALVMLAEDVEFEAPELVRAAGAIGDSERDDRDRSTTVELGQTGENYLELATVDLADP